MLVEIGDPPEAGAAGVADVARHLRVHRRPGSAICNSRYMPLLVVVYRVGSLMCGWGKSGGRGMLEDWMEDFFALR